jgi:cardiolipin synthase
MRNVREGRQAEERSADFCGPAGQQGAEEDILRDHPALMEAVGVGPVTSGNRVTLLIDGEATFGAMLNAVREAKDHVNVETYIVHDDEVGRQFAELLLKKRSEGVAVNLIYDGVACRRTARSFFEHLRRGGVKAVEFNPLSLSRILRGKSVFHRTHRKVLIVDGVVAFTGGINIGRAYLKSRRPGDKVSPPEDFWRDTDVMVEGPAVAEFQKLFFATWERQKGPAVSEAGYFPETGQKGDHTVQVVGSTRGRVHRATYLMYVAALDCARKSAHLTQSYFAPGGQVLEALRNAARRGVDVRVILPGSTDHAVVRQAGRRRYAQLLGSGVKLYERQGAILHAKTAVIDGVWSTVGTTNLEMWSLGRNDEINAVVLGPEFGALMEESFADDLAQSRQILPQEWSERPLLERVAQGFWGLFDTWL